jgi:hypothetical protein
VADDAVSIETAELKLYVGRLAKGTFRREVERLMASSADIVACREVRRGVFSTRFVVTVRASKDELDDVVRRVKQELHQHSAPE